MYFYLCMKYKTEFTHIIDSHIILLTGIKWCSLVLVEI